MTELAMAAFSDARQVARILRAHSQEVFVSLIASALSIPDRDGTHVWISMCDSGGWDISVEVGGRTVVREHCADWHRVERRRALLRAQFRAGTAAEQPVVSTH
jgi:hypothetical protein